MLNSIRRFVACAVLTAVVALMIPVSAVRADDTPLNQDPTAYWQVMTAATPPPDPSPAANRCCNRQPEQVIQDYQQLHQ